jgi:prepilin-type processing-associated H-X9-DG protein
MAEREVLPYAAPAPRVSRLAVGVFVASIVGAVLFFLVVPAAVVLLAAMAVGTWLHRRPDLDGLGYTRRAVVISCLAVVGGILVVLMPNLASHHRPSHSVCAANLRRIIQDLNVYAADNADAFPIVAYAPYSAGLNDARAGLVRAATADDVIKTYYARPPRQAGSPQAILWQLVLRGDVSPKSFICDGYPHVTEEAAGKRESAAVVDAAGRNFDNVQDGRQLSYSMAYPWKADGTVGNWWRATLDASLPLMADMAPLQGTGTPAVDLTSAPLTRAANSRNHKGDGQNVAYADGHVEFQRLPNVGQANDNIYTSSAVPSVGPAATGGVPADKISPSLTADRAPFDIVMYPVRDETTGRY